MKLIFKNITGKLSFQIGLAVVIFITLIEIVIFQVTLDKRKGDFYNLANEINQEAAKHGVSKILDDKYIEVHVEEFTRNVIVAVLVIIFVVTVGVLLILHFIVTRHIYELDRINQETNLESVLLFPESNIPNNELGDSIRQRNDMVHKLHQMHRGLLAGRAATEVYRVSNKISHEVLNPLSIVSGSSEIIRESTDDEMIERYLTQIDSSVDRITTLISSLNKHGELLTKYEVTSFCLKKVIMDLIQDSAFDEFSVEIDSDCAADYCIVDNIERVSFVVETIMKICNRELVRSDVNKMKVDIKKDDRCTIVKFEMGPNIDTNEIDEQFKSDSLSVVDVGFGEGADLYLSKTLVELGHGAINSYHDNDSAGIIVEFPNFDGEKEAS